MTTEVLFRLASDPYPRLKAWRKLQAALYKAEARLFRFIFILMQIRQFCGQGEATSEFDEIMAELALNLVADDTAQHRRWRATQDEVMTYLAWFRRRQVGNRLQISKPILARVNKMIQSRGVGRWTDANYKPFMRRLKTLGDASSVAVGKARVRCYRREVKRGVSVLIDSVFNHECRTLTVRRVAGNRATLSDGSRAVFTVSKSTFSRPYGKWRIVSGPYKGQEIRAEMPHDKTLIAAKLGLVLPDLSIAKAAPSRLIDPAFRVKLAEIPEGRDMAAGGTMNLGDVGESVLPKAKLGTMATYLIRRFGYPARGGDSHKDLMGAWVISTPETGLSIEIATVGSGDGYSLSYILSRPASREVREATDLWWSGLRTRTGAGADRAVAVIARYYRAARIALADLMRPVEARDQWITAEGIFDNDQGDFTEDGLVGAVAHDATCSYGVDRRTLENFDEHFDLMRVVAALDPDFKKGLGKAVAIILKRSKKAARAFRK